MKLKRERSDNNSLTKKDFEFLNVAKRVVRRLRMFRVSSIYRMFGGDKDRARGILAKLSGAGYFVNIPGQDHHLFFSNNPNFYTPKELLGLIPEKEKQRILRHIPADDSIDIEDLAENLYGKRIGEELLRTFLSNYVKRGLMSVTESGVYRLTTLGKEYGLDLQSLRTIDAHILEETLVLRRKGDGRFKSFGEVRFALQKDLDAKIIEPIDVISLVKGDSFTILPLCEILFGNRFTDTRLLSAILEKEQPVLTVTSGLVQGNYLGYRIDKCRTLSFDSGLNEIETQFAVANLLLKNLEKITRGKLFVVMGDDDWDLALSYARLAQAAEGKSFGPSWGQAWTRGGATYEMKKRLEWLAFYRKWKIQQQIIIPYQYRIGRSLLNRQEVFDRIQVWKSEYRLIMEILTAKEKNFSYPRKYEEIVDVKELTDHKSSRKRIVTPDSLVLKLGDKQIQVVHNTQFSSITQYVDPLYTSESVMRNLGAKGKEMPWILMDCHQEKFFAASIQNHWVMTLPGLQDSTLAAQYRIPEFERFVLQSKSHRQNTFRKEPSSSGAIVLEPYKDGRLAFRLLNNTFLDILEREKNNLEKTETLAVVNDTQFGSVTMFPDYLAKFLDYSLYERKVQRIWANGDIIHGVIYPNHFAENRPYRLTSVDSQLRFAKFLMGPIIQYAPNLYSYVQWMGNHEWNIWQNNITGENALLALEFYFQGLIDGQRMAGRKIKFQEAISASRIRWSQTTNPGGGDMMNHPFHSDIIAGFKVAMTHMWLPHGGGRTPVDMQRRWLRGMAFAAKDINIMVGGDKHSIWMSQEADKFLIQTPAAAGQSGFELARGLMSTIQFVLITFSNRKGVTVEFIPWEFLDKYHCQSPFLKGKDNELKRPERDTKEYRYMKTSPFVEHLIDEVTQGREV
ncbi:MAG: hypothetical protein QMD50_02925 [Patescibacteria group bacterium]|nr:hypothetical protein [Patescibacteria group bacterium]